MPTRRGDDHPWSVVVAVCTLAATLIGVCTIYQTVSDRTAAQASRLTHLEDEVLELQSRVDRVERRSSK